MKALWSLRGSLRKSIGQSLCFIPIGGLFGGLRRPLEPKGFIGKSIGKFLCFITIGGPFVIFSCPLEPQRFLKKSIGQSLCFTTGGWRLPQESKEVPCLSPFDSYQLSGRPCKDALRACPRTISSKKAPSPKILKLVSFFRESSPDAKSFFRGENGVDLEECGPPKVSPKNKSG